ncbi:MAG: hypothetical protein AAB400_03115 [Patescibacteria group bacterium]
MKYLWLLGASAILLALQITLIPTVDILVIGLVLVVFFFSEEEAITYALISGFLRDLFFPLFGFHLVLYGIECLVGIVLINTIITHRSFLGFTGNTWSILIINLSLTPLLLALISYSIPTYGFAVPSRTDAIESVLSLLVVYSVASIGYVIIGRLHYVRRYGMTIDRV